MGGVPSSTPLNPPGQESSRFHIDNVTGAITLLRAVESSRNTPTISLSVMVGLGGHRGAWGSQGDGG